MDLNSKRGSGRSERMVFDAINTAIGKHRFERVYIFAEDVSHIRSIVDDYFKPSISNRVVIKRLLIQDVHAHIVDFKGYLARELGIKPAQVYIDHWVIEHFIEQRVKQSWVDLVNEYA